MLNDLTRFSSDRNSAGVVESDGNEPLLLLKTFEASAQGWFWSVDQEGALTYISESVAELLGASSGALLGQSFSDIFAQADDDFSGRTLSFLLARRSAFEKITVRPSEENIERYWTVSGTPHFGRSGQFAGYRGSAVDVTEQRRSSEHASQLAKYDPLTGLPNRRRMAEVLEGHLRQADQQHQTCAVMLIDLDRFKQVNDTLGHPAGDALLKQVADRLIRIVGDKERVFRLGGDEFQVILPNCDDREAIGEIASRLISIVSQPYPIGGRRCVIGASIGVALAPADGRTRVDLIRNADLALYGSKGDGRGRYKFFSSDLLEAAEDRRGLEEDLRDALAREGMGLAYQPIVDATSNLITGVEALLRWSHPVKGAISPAVFVPIAEEAGIIGELGTWALRKACEDAASWPGTLRVAVNVSPVQFNSDSLPGTVLSALATSGLSPDRLELEITEGVFLGDTPAIDAMFATLKSIGVRLALDDFGTGYASLGYLRTAPFDKIKIDQTFVREATLPGSRNGAIIAAIVALAEALGMETTAEGIEYMDQLDLIRSLRVSHVQGWVYSAALSSAELVERLGDGNWAIDPSGPQKQRSNRQSVYRKVGVIHGRRYQTAIVRNLSETGALIQGLNELPPRTLVVVDFGDGQMTFARVARITGPHIGVEFEEELVEDGTGNLCTSQRVSPYALASSGLPRPGDPEKIIADSDAPAALETLAQKLGLNHPSRQQRAGPVMSLQWAPALAQDRVPTIKDISRRYLDSLLGDEEARESAERDLADHILPSFGQFRLDQVGETEIAAWLTSRGEAGNANGPDVARLQRLLGRIWTLAVDLKLADAELNPMQGSLRLDRRGQGESVLSEEQAQQLLLAARASPNRQLKYVISLLMLTGGRTGEILNVQWDHIDLAGALWRVRVPGTEETRELHLSGSAVAFLDGVPRLEHCPYVVANPATKKPYRSLTQSWEVVKAKANLCHLELDDLRYCHFATEIWQSQLFKLLHQQDSREALAAAD